MFKDYYAILEISQSATLDEIKSAFRSQALKWHPDKNHGMDTTEKMKKINEAKFILTDEEARVRYDKEYLRFKTFKQEKEKTKKTEESKQKQYEQKEQEQSKSTEEKTYGSKPEKSKEEYSTYQFEDEILKKWMENARKQAMRNVKEMISEFRGSSLIGFGAFFETALMAIVIGLVFFIIVQTLKAI